MHVFYELFKLIILIINFKIKKKKKKWINNYF